MARIQFPDLIEFNFYGGSYDAYEAALLDVYERDLWKGKLKFRGLDVKPRVHKQFELNGKKLDWTFAHFTSKGDIESEREFDLRRCERIGYIKPIVDNCHLPCVKVWENSRENNKKQLETSVVLWCEEVNVKIVLQRICSKQGTYYYIIKTFYLVNDPHRIKKENREYEEYVRKNGVYSLEPDYQKQ